MKEAVQNLITRDRFRYSLVWEGVVIGLIAGGIISVFRWLLILAEDGRNHLTAWMHGTTWTAAGAAADGSTAGTLAELASMPVLPGRAAVCAGVLLAVLAVVTILLELEPEIAGSGIPQVEAELMGRKDMCWWKVVLCKLPGCAAAIGGGLALGREGPSIQLGAMTGKGFARLRHRNLTEERILISCGSGAGLSAAFGAPLAGALFALEELHRNFSAEVLIATMAAGAASEFVAANVFGFTPVFNFDVEDAIPFRYYWAVLVFGVLMGLFGRFYNRTIAWMQDGLDRAGAAFAAAAGKILRKNPYSATDAARQTVFGRRAGRVGRMLVVLAAAWILMFRYPLALGSGSFLVAEISSGRFALAALAVLLIIKFVFSTASFGSGSPGGIFLPLLVLGAVSGGVFTRLLGLAGMDQKYMTAFVVLGMAGYFAAIVHAPVTGVVLITEMTGDFTSLLPLVLISLTAYVTAERCGGERSTHSCCTAVWEASRRGGPGCCGNARPSSTRTSTPARIWTEGR